MTADNNTYLEGFGQVGGIRQDRMTVGFVAQLGQLGMLPEWGCISCAPLQYSYFRCTPIPCHGKLCRCMG